MLIVQKFGGTSVGDLDRIRRVADVIARAVRAGHRVVVSVSAMGGETDKLLSLARGLDGERHSREMDVLLATGEQRSAALLAIALRNSGHEARSFLGHQVCIRTDSSFSRARIRGVDATYLQHALDRGEIPVVAGFQGVDPDGNITTLGRGGSDTTAVALAASLCADLCEIYTDVNGVYTADPRICPNARFIPRITFQEMLELASLGAKVLQIRSVELAGRHNIPIHVRSTFCDEEGTMVTGEESLLEDIVVSGVTLDAKTARITLKGLPYGSGIQSKIFKPLGDAGVIVDMIVQNPPDNERTNLSFTLAQQDTDRALASLYPLTNTVGVHATSDRNLSKVSIVGLGMRSHAGVAEKMFRLLGEAGIEILMISTSEIKVSCIIDERHGERALRLLHEHFCL